MIEIICKEDLYTYNVYHITKAFFATEGIVQKVDEDADAILQITFEDGEKLVLPEGELTLPKERKQRKYMVDCWLYETYKGRTKKSLAWGLLTGVRPTKIAMQKLEEGMEKEAFVQWFQKDALVSEEKARLAYEIAQREKTILSPLDYKDGYSLYVGIPFCPTVCTYCSFSSGAYEQWKDYVDAYLDALCKELIFIGKASKGKKLNTIYIGGGTPTTLNPAQLDKLLTCIDQTFSRKDLLEFTVEAGRPDSISREKLEVLKAHQITRISINPQTMQQKTLDVIGRKHTVEDVKNIFGMARELGFDNINMDLIAGLPGETRDDMEDTLKQIRELAPDSLTVHSLAIKRAAKMGQEKKITGQVTGLEDLQEDIGKMETELSAMIDLAAQAAEEMELVPYYLYRQKNIAGNFENVGYAKVDKAGIYNILIMEEKQSIVAAGAGASTKIVLDEPMIVPGSRHKRETTLLRMENVKDIKEYIRRIDEMIERKGEYLWH